MTSDALRLLTAVGPPREQPHLVLCGRKDLSTRSRFRARRGAPLAPPPLGTGDWQLVTGN